MSTDIKTNTAIGVVAKIQGVATVKSGEGVLTLKVGDTIYRSDILTLQNQQDTVKVLMVDGSFADITGMVPFDFSDYLLEEEKSEASNSAAQEAPQEAGAPISIAVIQKMIIAGIDPVYVSEAVTTCKPTTWNAHGFEQGVIQGDQNGLDVTSVSSPQIAYTHGVDSIALSALAPAVQPASGIMFQPEAPIIPEPGPASIDPAPSAHIPLLDVSVLMPYENGPEVSIPDYALLYAASAPTDQPVTVTGVSNASGGTVSHIDGMVIFTEESPGLPASFDYTATANGINGTGHVTVGRNSESDSSVLSGDNQNNILIGSDNAIFGSDILMGYGGNDVLIAGRGGASETFVGGEGNDLIVLSDNAESGGATVKYTSVLDGTDIITNFSEGKDVLDLTELFDNLGIISNAERAERVQVVNTAPNTFEVSISTTGSEFDLHVATVYTTSVTAQISVEAGDIQVGGGGGF